MEMDTGGRETLHKSRLLGSRLSANCGSQPVSGSVSALRLA